MREREKVRVRETENGEQKEKKEKVIEKPKLFFTSGERVREGKKQSKRGSGREKERY